MGWFTDNAPPQYGGMGAPPMSDQMNPSGGGGFGGGGFSLPVSPVVSTLPQPYQQGPSNPYENDFSPRNPDGSLVTGPLVQSSGGQQQQGGGGVSNPQQAFQEAVQALGVTPQQFRSNPEVMDKVTNYLNQKYGGGWGNGGQRAGDWVSYQGQGFDVLPAGDKNWQWLSDPAGSQAGAGGQGGYWTGNQTGGGQYPLAAAGGPGLATPWTTPFNAPDNLTEQNDPGFMARMKMGTDAIQRSAAAKGTLLTGGLMKGLDRYAQDYASNEYSNVYNRALGQYQMAYDIFNNNGNTLFNRLSSLGSVGENAAAGVGNSQIGVGNAQAAGSINQGNIWGNVANQAGTTVQNIYNNQAFRRPDYQNPMELPTVSGYPSGVGAGGGTTF
jgi:hypothetical protein